MRDGRSFVRRCLLGALAGTILSAGFVALDTTVAAAAVTATSSGSTVSVNVTGTASVPFGCSGVGTFLVNGAAPTPPIACDAVTQVTVTGDGATQIVHGDDLDSARFAGGPRLVANVGGGNDVVWGTPRSDLIDLGSGSDQLWFDPATVPDDTDFGPTGSTEILNVDNRGNGASEIDLWSVGEPLHVEWKAPSQTLRDHSFEGVVEVSFVGSESNEVFDASPAGTVDSLQSVYADGNGGNDDLEGGPVESTLVGGSGTNVLEAGSAGGRIISQSDTDTIRAHPDAEGTVIDRPGLRSGRTFESLGGMSPVVESGNDVVVRFRRGAGGTATRTLSLNRFGKQSIPAGDAHTEVAIASTVEGRNIVDVEAIDGRRVEVQGDGTTILDITVPTGSWAGSSSNGTVSMNPSDEPYGNIYGEQIADYSIHRPWTDRNEGFAHRVHRDLMFELLPDDDREAQRDRLEAGLTRTQMVAELTGTDAYRGLDVDRVFAKFLRRTSDPGGRSYWIGSLRGGKTLRLFRAQLFGSNEYFTKAGGTNAKFLDRAYADVMGRLPDAGGRAYWVARLNAGMDRGSVVTNFLTSTEARRTLVREQFLRFVDRQPSASEQTTWIAALGNGAVDGELALIRYLAASATYYAST